MIDVELSAPDEAVRQFLIGLATKHEKPMSYMIMSKAVDPDGNLGFRDHNRSKPLTSALRRINIFEFNHGRPMLGALAVSKTTGNAGTGFAGVGREVGLQIEWTPEAEFRFWQEQRDACYAYWAKHQADEEDAPEASGMSNAQFTAVMNELVTIKRLVRQLIHG